MILLRKLLLGAFLLALALAAGLAAFLYTLDVAAYKARLVDAVASATGRSFAISGDIAFTPALLPTVAVHGLTLGNAEWAGPEPLATIARAEAAVDLRALLERRFEITRIQLAGVELSLARATDGRGNWEFAAGEKATSGAPARRLPPIALRALDIEDLRLTYRSAGAPPETLLVDSLELRSPADAAETSLALVARLRERPLRISGTLAPLSAILSGAALPLALSAQLGELDMTLSGSIAEPLAGRGLDLVLAAKAPVTAALASLLGRPLTELGPLALSLRLRDTDAAWLLEEVDASAGQLGARGRLAISRDSPRPSVRGKLDLGTLDLRPWQAPPGKRPAGERLFPTEPLALDALRAADLELTLHIAQLKTRSIAGADLDIPLALASGRLSARGVRGQLGGGALALDLVLDAAATPPQLELALTVDDLALTTLLPDDSARGGHADIELAALARGVSPAALAGSATGRVRFDARDIELVGGGVGLASTDLLLQAFTLVNPLASRDARSRIECAVLNFPINAGRMQAASGLGVRTDKLNVLGGGTIDLATETLDIGINPKPRAGIGLNVAGLAEFVRIGGTLSKPAPVTDSSGMASAGVKVGAAMATGGLSLLAEGLLDRAEGDVDVCAIARGEQALPAAAQPAQPSAVEKAASGATNTLKSAGGAIKDAFKGLFGR